MRHRIQACWHRITALQNMRHRIQACWHRITALQNMRHRILACNIAPRHCIPALLNMRRRILACNIAPLPATLQAQKAKTYSTLGQKNSCAFACQQVHMCLLADKSPRGTDRSF